LNTILKTCFKYTAYLSAFGEPVSFWQVPLKAFQFGEFKEFTSCRGSVPDIRFISGIDMHDGKVSLVRPDAAVWWI